MTYLDDLLNDEVDDIEDEEALAGKDNIVHRRDVTNQLDSAEVPGRYHAAGRRKLAQQPEAV